MQNHLVNHIPDHSLRTDNVLHVVGVMTNHQRWNSRVRLAKAWIKRMLATPNVRLHIVEVAYKTRRHELMPQCGEDYDYVSLTTNTHAWMKEAMINHAFKRAIHRENAKFLSWIDMDVEFMNHETWAQAALHEMLVHPLIQPWSHAVDLGPHNEVLLSVESFGSVQQTGKPLKIEKNPCYSYPHPGYAWACTAELFQNMPGGLLDFCVVGNADWHMAWCAVGRGQETLRHNYSHAYKHRVLAWQNAVVKITGKQVGYINGLLKHYFHGSKENRFYISRAEILDTHKYCPDLHLKHDENGLIYIHNNPGLDRAIMKYGLSRREDSVDP